MEMKNSAAQLLERVSVTAKKIDEQYRKTGMAYNIFKVAGISEKETRICRVIADLLNPKGHHYQGSTYLKLFMEMVVHTSINETKALNLENVKVTTEYATNKGRFIDIVIDDGIIFIPIEVKINAGEQKKQLADYADFSRRMNSSAGFIPVLFLTPDGRESYEAPKTDYVSISFKKNIILWLEKCLILEETNNAAPIRETLKQLIKAIKSFCGFMEDEAMENEINALIAESRENYIAASLISKAYNELDFNLKAYEVFKDKIYDLVKKKIHDVKFLDEGEGDDEWNYLYIPIGNDFLLSINYDWQSITIQSVNSKKTLSAEIADKIRKTMTGKLHSHDEVWGDDYIWASSSTRYSGLENIEDKSIYKYELYHIYLIDSQSVADKVVSIVTELKSIL